MVDAGRDVAAHPSHDATAPRPDTGKDSQPALLDAGSPPPLGGHYDATSATYTFAVRSQHATRIVADLFAAAQGQAAKLEVVTEQAPGTDVWWAAVSAADVAAAGIGTTVYYGYRAWGPNWPYVAGWTPGSSAGFLSNWDASGNTFDPNKLLIDPFTREISHDPLTPAYDDGSVYSVSTHNASKDSALSAPKSIVLPDATLDTGVKPTRALTDDIIYEVHVRGLTENDPTVTSCAGTYQAAAQKASWLGSLGVTAIEVLPVMEAENDLNDVAQSTASQDYWDYSTLGFFTVDRRYACDQSPGGPTSEFAAMVKAMHDAGIKVFLDAVYNHTAEGGSEQLYSWRGLDNASYYELASDASGFVDNTGCGASFNVANPIAADLVLRSLQYFSGQLGVDGFRFDEAAECSATRAPRAATRSMRRARPGSFSRSRPCSPGRPSSLSRGPSATGPISSATSRPVVGVERQLPRRRPDAREQAARRRHPDVDLAGRVERVAEPLRLALALVVDQLRGLSRRLHSARRVRLQRAGQHAAMAVRSVQRRRDRRDAVGPGGRRADQQQAERVAIALLVTSAGVPMITGGDELGDASSATTTRTTSTRLPTGSTGPTPTRTAPPSSAAPSRRGRRTRRSDRRASARGPTTTATVCPT